MTAPFAKLPPVSEHPAAWRKHDRPSALRAVAACLRLDLPWLRRVRDAVEDLVATRERETEDQPPVRVPCEVRAASPLHVGPATASVGFCKAYPGGPHALLTLRQRTPDVVEVALTPDQAETLARKLLRAAANLRREQADRAPAETTPEPLPGAAREAGRRSPGKDAPR